KSRERQPITHLILHLLVRKIVERLQNQHSKHHNRIERLPAGTTLPHLLRCQHYSLDVGAKPLPWHQSIDCFKRIALRRQHDQPLVRIKDPQLPHPALRESSPSRVRFAQVSGRSYFSRCPYSLARIVLDPLSAIFLSHNSHPAVPRTQSLPVSNPPAGAETNVKFLSDSRTTCNYQNLRHYSIDWDAS